MARKSTKRYSKKRTNKTRKIRHSKSKSKRSSKRSGKSSGHGHKRHHAHSKYMMHGGTAPPPWVGSPYDATQLNPKGNFLPLSDQYGVPSGLPVPPAPSNPQFGGSWGSMKGKGKRSKGKKQRGGGISEMMSAFQTMVPDELMNAVRYVPSTVTNVMDKFNGYISPASSQVYPTQQPLAQQLQVANTTVAPPNINSANSRAVSSVFGS
jgi:hypothetical protein